MRASENWTDTAQGSIMNFSTTANGTTGSITRMTIGSNGNVGIGVFGAQANLEVSNANGASGAGTIFATTFTNAGTSLFVGRRARGTGIAPTAVLSGDNLVGFLAQGYGTTGFSGTRGGMFVQAAENWTDTAQGTRLHFNTTATGTTTPAHEDDHRSVRQPRHRHDRAVGSPGSGEGNSAGPLEIASHAVRGNIKQRRTKHRAADGARNQSGSDVPCRLVTSWGASVRPATAQPTSATAAQVSARSQRRTGPTRRRAPPWRSRTTPLGSNEAQVNMVILPGRQRRHRVSSSDFPTITDKLQVFGDIRVGTTGTNGCLKNFAGTGLVGTCSSDRRFKKDITPFGPVLNQLTALQPVHYFWRAADFPEQHFGDSRAYGLIAQDVEQVLPELVVTGDDGFKAVDYSKLPLLTIQAVKELKAENDALKRRGDRESKTEALKQRVAELERLVNELLATSSRR